MDAVNDRSEASPRCCVYTALTGRYEKLNEQPAAHGSSIPFICFTDNPDLVSDTWQFRPLAPVFAADHSRNQRAYKLCPHRHLPDFDRSLYIDNTVLLKVAPEHVFATADLSSGVSLPEHSARETVLDEFLAVAAEGLDDPNRIFEQLNQYSIETPGILCSRPFWCGILLRDHHRPRVVEAMEIWLAHVFRYARRDQLSAGYAFSLAGLQPNVMRIDNRTSWFHSWPHAIQRDDRRNWHAAVALAPLGAQVRLLEQKGSESRARIAHLEQALADQSRQQADQVKQQADRAQQLADQTQQQRDAAAAREACLEGLFQDRERVLQVALDDSERHQEALLASRTWRLLKPLRTLGQRFPRLAGLSRRARVV